jgi:hypothetical protein
MFVVLRLDLLQGGRAVRKQHGPKSEAVETRIDANQTDRSDPVRDGSRTASDSSVGPASGSIGSRDDVDSDGFITGRQ